VGRNQHRTAGRGREPGLLLERAGQEVTLTEWGAELVGECMPLATAFDIAHGGTQYGDAVRAAEVSLRHPDTLPSARVLAAMAGDHDNSFTGFVRAQSLQTRDTFLALPFADEARRGFEAQAGKSVEERQQIESTDTLPFEDYREQYVSPGRLGIRHSWADALAPATN